MCLENTDIQVNEIKQSMIKMRISTEIETVKENQTSSGVEKYSNWIEEFTRGAWYHAWSSRRKNQ